MTHPASHPFIPSRQALHVEAEAAAVTDQAASGTLPPSLDRRSTSGFGRSTQGPIGGRNRKEAI